MILASRLRSLDATQLRCVRKRMPRLLLLEHRDRSVVRRGGRRRSRRIVHPALLQNRLLPGDLIFRPRQLLFLQTRERTFSSERERQLSRLLHERVKMLVMAARSRSFASAELSLALLRRSSVTKSSGCGGLSSSGRPMSVRQAKATLFALRRVLTFNAVDDPLLDLDRRS